jgi:glycerol-3-phosphate O-acyltransferase
LTGRFEGFGTAAVRFGEPLSLDEFLQGQTSSPVEAVGQEIMARVARVVPVLAVPLCARALMQGPADEAALVARMEAMMATLGARGVDLPAESAAVLAAAALAPFRRRGIVVCEGQFLAVAQGQEAVVAYYANTIAHHFAER